MSYRIVMNHAHVFPENVKPHGSIENLKRLMDECGIDKAVAFAPFEKNYRNFDGEVEKRTNLWLSEAIKNEPDIVGFGVVNFEQGNIKEQVEEIHSYGFKGIKFHPAFQQVRLDSEEAYAVFEKAEELGLFISFHTGLHWHRLSDYHMLMFDDIAWDFPKLRFSMEHMGGYSFFNTALAVMCNNSRKGDTVFAGITSNGNENGNGTWSLTDQQIKDIIFQTGESRIIMGLDFPYNDAESTKRSINRIINLDIPESAKRAMLGENLEKIIG